MSCEWVNNDGADTPQKIVDSVLNGIYELGTPGPE